MTQLAPDVVPRPAATILLLRDAPTLQVLMVRRHHQIDFASGALVFPGGKVSPADADPAWADASLGWEASAAEERALRIAAIREAFEESGVLLAQDCGGGPWRGAAHTLQQRAAVDRGERPFIEVVRDSGAVLDLGALTAASRWITPAGMPKRFDTWFFVARAPEDQSAVSDGREAVDAEWIAPSRALELGLRKERKLMFPTRLNLKVLAQSDTAQEVISAAAARPLVTVCPEIKDSPQGPMVHIPAEAGYGVTQALLSEDGGGRA